MKYICTKRFYAKLYESDRTICKTLVDIGTHWELKEVHDVIYGEEFYCFLGDDGKYIIVSRNKMKNMKKLDKKIEDRMYSLQEAKTDYNKSLNIKSCGNCDFCNRFFGNRNHPITCSCLVKEKIFLFNRASKCKYYKYKFL